MSSSENGFSLVELVVAMAIFGISVAAFAGELLTSTRGNRLSKETSDAIALAQNELEAKPTTSGSDNSGIFSRSWTVTNWTIASNGTDQARTVTVTVSWRDGPIRSISLQSILSS